MMASGLGSNIGALAPMLLFNPGMNSAVAMNRFLAGVEKKAFYMAKVAVGNEDDALDIVQDAMFMLARKYADKDEAQWQPLFYRILQNRITDVHRRRSVRRRIFSLFSPAEGQEDDDPVLRVPGPASEEPATRASLDAATGRMSELVAQLPLRQQQAFLLRALEGLDIRETAEAMKCSQGSVKTHYSRAVHALREKLGDHWP